jgi:hypothetical protein
MFGEMSFDWRHTIWRSDKATVHCIIPYYSPVVNNTPEYTPLQILYLDCMSAYQSRNSVEPIAFEKFCYSLTRASFVDVDQYQFRPPVGTQTHILLLSEMKREYGHPQYRFVLLTWRTDYLRRIREICVQLKSDLRNPWNVCMPPCLLVETHTSRKVTGHHATTALSLRRPELILQGQ